MCFIRLISVSPELAELTRVVSPELRKICLSITTFLYYITNLMEKLNYPF